MRPRLELLVVTLLVAGSVGCAASVEQVAEMTANTQELAEPDRYCLGLARAVAAYETGSLQTAAEAAEEMLVQAPDEVRDDTRSLVEALRSAQDGEVELLDDAGLHDAIERLRSRTGQLCEPST